MVAKVDLVTPQTFLTKIKKRRGSASGFTLLEVMIAVGIIAAVITLIVPRIDNRNNQIKAAVRKFIALSRDLHSRAKLENATYRLVLDMKAGETALNHEFWVEKSTKKILLNKEALADINKEKRGLEQEKEEEEKKKQSRDGFEMYPKITPKPVVLIEGLKISDVELFSLEQPVTTGKAYIYFHPEGFATEAAIHLKMGEDLKWTVAIHPLTGRAEIMAEYMTLKKIKEQ